MKAAEAKKTSTAGHLQKKMNAPFFNKGREESFFSKSNQGPGFFFKPASVQFKLNIGKPNDIYEKEAESMADKVVQRLSDSSSIQTKFNSIGSVTPFVQKKCAHCEEEEKLQKKEKEDDNLLDGKLQKKPIFESDAEPRDDDTNVQRKCAECQKEKLQKKADSSDSLTVTPNIEKKLISSKGSGSSMLPATREQMESSFGEDFSDVRLHNDSSSAQMTEGLKAQAFTHGKDIYFNQGKYNPESSSGRYLLAHELTHTVQQSGKITKKIQRVNTFFGPASTGVPSNWSDQVSAATTSTQKAALIQSVLGSSIVVNDRTQQSASDTSPTGTHLTTYSRSTPTINYDENLNSKSSPVDHRSLAPNAGYTLHSGSNFYIILGPLCIKSDNFYSTIVTVNHEFDHVRQTLSGSALSGNESELDAWTSTFLREFHRTYILGNVGGSGTNCYVQFIDQFMPLQFYYQKPNVSTIQKDAAIGRMSTYYSRSIVVHPAHVKVFRFWIHKMLRNSPYKDLVTRLNTDLSLGIIGSDPLSSTRQFSCIGITNATFSAPPSLNLPVLPRAIGAGP